MTTIRTIAASTLVVLGAAGAEAQTLKMIASGPNPPTHWLNTQGMDPLNACIEKQSNGAIDIDFFPSGQIASTAGQLDAMNGGLAQLALVATSSNSDKLPLNQITMLPDMGDTSTSIVAAYRRVMEADGVLMAELKANHLHPLTVIYLPPYQIGLKGAKLDSIDDFTGKKIRVAGGGQVFSIEALGGVPVQIQAGDAYVAMQQGTIDGFSFSITSVTAYKLEELTGSISTNGNFANAQTFLAVDDRWFAEQSPENQKVLTDCGLQVEASLAAYLDELNTKLIQDFSAAGVDMYEFSPELWAEISKKLEPVAAEYIARMAGLGLKGQEAYDEYRKALGK